jgi:hypothetical protein
MNRNVSDISDCVHYLHFYEDEQQIGVRFKSNFDREYLYNTDNYQSHKYELIFREKLLRENPDCGMSIGQKVNQLIRSGRFTLV